VVTHGQLIVADLETAAVRRERLLFDPTGHYARRDVFDFSVDRRRKDSARFIDSVRLIDEAP
jgi:nitrilase